MELNLIIAFAAGLVSFLSPCVLPILPGFLAYLGGSSAGETPSRKQVFLASVFFVLGFSVIFALLGVLLNGILSDVAYGVQQWLSYIGGIIIIIFGLFLTGLIRVRFLEGSHTIAVKHKFKSRYVTSFVFGSAFAVGWTPCVGAALGAILALAVTSPGSAFALLMSYGLGLGLPFLVLGAFAGQASAWLGKFGKSLVIINKVFGVLLIVLGVLVFTQSLSLVSNFEFLNKILLK
ncbi:MAG: cytochrome c-type biogenesis protein [Planctomycetota bacterium]|jgi:cytochrome c-type biogenesis protein